MSFPVRRAFQVARPKVMGKARNKIVNRMEKSELKAMPFSIMSSDSTLMLIFLASAFKKE